MKRLSSVFMVLRRYVATTAMMSVLDPGLWPILQMTLLPPLTFWTARQGAEHSATKGETL